METLGTTLLSAIITISLFLAVLSWHIGKTTKDISRPYLALFLLSGSVYLSGLLLQPLLTQTVFIYFKGALLLLILPAFYLYAKALLMMKRPAFPAAFKHFVPTLLILLALLLDQALMLLSSGNKPLLIMEIPGLFEQFYFKLWAKGLPVVVVAVQLVIYLLFVFRQWDGFTASLKTHYGTTAQFKPKWLLWSLLAFVVFYALGDLALMLSLIGSQFYALLFLVVMAAMLFLTAYYGIFVAPVVSVDKRGKLFFGTFAYKPLLNGLDPENSNRNTKANGHNKNGELIQKLESYLQQTHFYLEQTVCLSDLAKDLSTNTQYLSRAINDHYGMNFNSFINRLRIRKMITMMRDENNNLSLWGMGQQVGFRSKGAYIKAFRNETGLSPNEYLEGLKKEEAVNL